MDGDTGHSLCRNLHGAGGRLCDGLSPGLGGRSGDGNLARLKGRGRRDKARAGYLCNGGIGALPSHRRRGVCGGGGHNRRRELQGAALGEHGAGLIQRDAGEHLVVHNADGLRNGLGRAALIGIGDGNRAGPDLGEGIGEVQLTSGNGLLRGLAVVVLKTRGDDHARRVEAIAYTVLGFGGRGGDPDAGEYPRLDGKRLFNKLRGVRGGRSADGGRACGDCRNRAIDNVSCPRGAGPDQVLVSRVDRADGRGPGHALAHIDGIGRCRGPGHAGYGHARRGDVLHSAGRRSIAFGIVAVGAGCGYGKGVVARGGHVCAEVMTVAARGPGCHISAVPLELDGIPACIAHSIPAGGRAAPAQVLGRCELGCRNRDGNGIRLRVVHSGGRGDHRVAHGYTGNFAGGRINRCVAGAIVGPGDGLGLSSIGGHGRSQRNLFADLNSCSAADADVCNRRQRCDGKKRQRHGKRQKRS